MRFAEAVDFLIDQFGTVRIKANGMRAAFILRISGILRFVPAQKSRPEFAKLNRYSPGRQSKTVKRPEYTAKGTVEYIRTPKAIELEPAIMLLGKWAYN